MSPFTVQLPLNVVPSAPVNAHLLPPFPLVVTIFPPFGTVCKARRRHLWYFPRIWRRGVVASGGGLEAIIEATDLRTRENVLGSIDTAILVRAFDNDDAAGAGAGAEMWAGRTPRWQLLGWRRPIGC
jgi:hypothetical protein